MQPDEEYDGEAIEPGENPYPNYHVAVVRDSGDFEEDSIRTGQLPKSHPDHKSAFLGKGGVLVRWGRLKDGDGSMTAQAYLFPKDTYTPSQCRKWLDHYEVEYKEFHAARDGGENSVGVEASRADAATFVDHGDYVSFYTIFASEGIFVSGDGEPGWRSAEEVRKMVPLCNGMRVVINHPAVDAAALACVDLNDKKHPVIGWTSDSKGVKTAGIQKVGGWTNIWKNRAGIDAREVIARLKSEELGDVSIGYFFARVPKEGTANGKPYRHLEQDVNPYHLAILDGFEPACPQPICGVGCSSSQSQEQEDNTMKPGESGGQPQGTPPPTTTPAECAGCKAHAEQQAKAQAAENEALKTKVQDLEKAVNDLKAKAKEGEEAKAKLDQIKADKRKAELEKLSKLLGEEKFKANFPEDAKGVSDEEIARTIRLLEKPADEEEADETVAPPEAEPETAAAKPAADPALKAPAGKTAPASGVNQDDGYLPPMYRKPGKLGEPLA